MGNGAGALRGLSPEDVGSHIEDELGHEFAQYKVNIVNNHLSGGKKSSIYSVIVLMQFCI